MKVLIQDLRDLVRDEEAARKRLQIRNAQLRIEVQTADRRVFAQDAQVCTAPSPTLQTHSSPPSHAWQIHRLKRRVTKLINSKRKLRDDNEHLFTQVGRLADSGVTSINWPPSHPRYVGHVWDGWNIAEFEPVVGVDVHPPAPPPPPFSPPGPPAAVWPGFAAMPDLF